MLIVVHSEQQKPGDKAVSVNLEWLLVEHSIAVRMNGNTMCHVERKKPHPGVHTLEFQTVPLSTSKQAKLIGGVRKQNGDRKGRRVGLLGSSDVLFLL